jgi:hypothetical protein
MVESAAPLRLVPLEPPAPDERGRQVAPMITRLTAKDLDAAERLADFHSKLVAQLPVDSELRGLALRAGGHWARLAGLPRRTLSQVGSGTPSSSVPLS